MPRLDQLADTAGSSVAPIDFSGAPKPVELPPYYVAAPGMPSQPPPFTPILPDQQPTIVDRQAYWQQQQEAQRQRAAVAQAAQAAAEAQRQAFQTELANKLKPFRPSMSQVSNVLEQNRRGIAASSPEINVTDFGYDPQDPSTWPAAQQKALQEAQRRDAAGVTGAHVVFPQENQTIGQGAAETAGGLAHLAGQTLDATVPGMPAIQSAVGEGAKVLASLPSPIDLIPGLDTRPFREKAAQMIAEGLIPTHVWDTALTLIPISKAKTPLELASAVLLGDTGAIDALRAAGKKVGQSRLVEQIVGREGELGQLMIPGTRRVVTHETLANAPQVLSATDIAYHGTGQRFKSFSGDLMDQTALYGPGVYLTDDAKIARSYAETRAWDVARAASKNERVAAIKTAVGPWTPFPPLRAGASEAIIQTVALKPGLRILNMERPFPLDIASKLVTVGEKSYGHDADAWFGAARAIKDGKLGKDVYREFVDGLQYADMSRSDAGESLDALNHMLQSVGYDGIAHIGGIQGGAKHTVTVIFDPANTKIETPLTRALALFKGGETGQFKLPFTKAAGGAAGGLPASAVDNLPQHPPAPVDPVETLLRAKTTEDMPQAGFLGRVLDQVRTGRQVISPEARANRATGARVLEKSKNIVVRYSGEIQQTIPRETGLEARALRRSLGETTQDQLRSITGALDDFDDATRARFLANLTPQQKVGYQTLRSNVDAMGDLLVARGILDPENRVNNYFSHVLDFTEQGKAFQGGRPLRTPAPKKVGLITGKRTQATLADDIVAGYRPVTLDPIKVYEQFMVEAKTRIAMADIIDDIRTFDPEGVQFLKPGQTAPEGFETVRHPMFEGQVAIDIQGQPRILRYRWAVRSNVAGYIKALAEPSALRGSKVGRAALTATSTLKRTALGGPLDLNFAGFEIKAASYAVGSDVRNILPGALHTAVMGQEAYDKFLMQEVEYLGKKMPRSAVYARLDAAGLTGGSYRTEISHMLGGEQQPTLIGLIPGVGKWYDKGQGIMESAQFDRLIPTLKNEAAAQLVAKKLRGKLVVTDEVMQAAEREAAADMNKAMGGLNRVAQGRSKTAQDIAALVAIAPDWLESRLQLFASAAIPGSRNATSRRFVARTMVAGGVSAVVGSAIYAHERGWDEEQTARYIGQNLNPIQIRDGKPSINPHFMEFQLPNGQWTSPLSWEKDLWRITFGLYAAATGDREGFDLTLGNFASARLGPALRFAKDAAINRDFRGLPIAKKGGWPGLLQFLEYEATQTGVPSFAREIGQAAIPGFPGGKQSGFGAAQNITGIGRARPLNPTDVLDRAVQDEAIPKTGGGTYLYYRDLPTDLKGEFNKRHPQEVADVQQARTERGTDTFDLLRKETADGLTGLAPMAQTDKATYRDQVGDFVMQRSAIMQHELEQLRASGVSFSDRSGDLGLMDRYFDAVDPATNQTTKVTDFDKRDALDETFRGTLTSTEKDRLDAMLVYSTDPTYQKLKLAKKELRDSGYFDRRDRSFLTWKSGLLAADATPANVKSLASDWQTPDDLMHYAQDLQRQHGNAPEKYSTLGIWNGWDNFSGKQNQHFLATHPEVDALAIEWGYQSRVHSAEAARLYTTRTGLKPPLPE